MLKDENLVFEISFVELQLRESKENEFLMQLGKSFYFGEYLFRLFKLIDLENGKLYVIGCDWMLENEIVIVD